MSNPETLESALDQIERLTAEVREWICENCNTVYPGPPQSGLMCVVCPSCQGSTMPLTVYERRKAEAERDRLRQERDGHLMVCTRLHGEERRLRAALELAINLLRQSFADESVWEMYWAKSKEAAPLREALAGGAVKPT